MPANGSSALNRAIAVRRDADLQVEQLRALVSRLETGGLHPELISRSLRELRDLTDDELEERINDQLGGGYVMMKNIPPDEIERREFRMTRE